MYLYAMQCLVGGCIVTVYSKLVYIKYYYYISHGTLCVH